MDSDIVTGDSVTRWSHPNEVGQVVRAESVRTGGTVFHVLWPEGKWAIPYPSAGALRKCEESA